MKTKKTLILILFLLFESISGKDICSPTFCSLTGPQVRFPFRIVDRQPSKCGFPGFDLSCNEKNQTILKLSSSRSFIVTTISYAAQVINVDPDFCGPERLARIQIAYTPFAYTFYESYTFYNCLSHNYVSSGISTMPIISFPCLGSVNHSVFAIKTSWAWEANIPQSCKEITRIQIPYIGYGDISWSELTLKWFRRYCRYCEVNGTTCEFKNDHGETNCIASSSSSSNGGISRGAKYGLSLGIGIPGPLFFFCFANYIIGKVENYNQDQRQNIELLSNAITRRPPSTTGLDRPM